MRIKIIGFSGILLIAGFLFYFFYDGFNMGPFFMGETVKVNGYIIENKIVPLGKSATHQIDFEYFINGSTYKDHYYTRKYISTLSKGDSLILEVSINNPSKCKVVGYYRLKNKSNLNYDKHAPSNY